MARTQTTNGTDTKAPDASTGQKPGEQDGGSSEAQQATAAQAGAATQPGAQASVSTTQAAPAAAAAAAQPGAADPKAKPAEDHAERQRADQTQCPRCFRFGCPAINGTRRVESVAMCYRKCKGCGWQFKTVTQGGKTRAVTSE